MSPVARNKRRNSRPDPKSSTNDLYRHRSGPYAFIRHPIYTGLILAMLGSAIGVNIFWALMLIPVGGYFIYSARREEAVMLQLFPEQYAAYMARTGMLAPRLIGRH